MQAFEDFIQKLRRAEDHQHGQRKAELFSIARYQESREDDVHGIITTDALRLFNPAGQKQGSFAVSCLSTRIDNVIPAAVSFGYYSSRLFAGVAGGSSCPLCV